MAAWGCPAIDDRGPVMPALELPAAREVVTGPGHTCSRHEDGTVWCWGAGGSGQLGTGETRNRARPTPVVGLDDAVELAAGDAFTCARRVGDRIACWGAGDAGQLGDHRGHLPDVMMLGGPPSQVYRLGPRGSAVPVAIPRAAGARRVVAAGQHACILQHSDRVWCWGSLGGTVLAGTDGVGIELDALHGADDLRTDRDRVCAHVDDDWRCWGRVEAGRQACEGLPGCGLSLWSRTTEPTTIAALGHACTIDATGRVACQGDNHHGQLGLGDVHDVASPSVILGYHRGRWRRWRR